MSGVENVTGVAARRAVDGSVLRSARSVGGGNDTLEGGDGNDSEQGGDGNDFLSQPGTSGGTAPDGDDDLLGGAGVDTISYGSHELGRQSPSTMLRNDGDRGPLENDNAHSDLENAP